MKLERVLSLDVSSKTGWALALSSDDGLILQDYGRIEKTSEPVGNYPSNYVIWAYQCFNEISQLVDRQHPDVLVIEETSKGSKNGLSQKILEWIHFLVARMIRETGFKSKYFQTEEWRRIIQCSKMSDADKKKNKAVREYKKLHKTEIAYDINGKRIGLVGKKHLNVRKANEIFADYLKEPLILAQEDIADALGLVAAYHAKRLEGKYE